MYIVLCVDVSFDQVEEDKTEKKANESVGDVTRQKNCFIQLVLTMVESVDNEQMKAQKEKDTRNQRIITHTHARTHTHIQPLHRPRG